MIKGTLKTGELSAYALGCGYIQKREIKIFGYPTIEITLWREADAYFVRVRDTEDKRDIALYGFPVKQLTRARSCFRAYLRAAWGDLDTTKWKDRRLN